MVNENFIILGAAINLVGGLFYVRLTLLGKIKPNRLSWGLWTLAVLVVGIAQVKQGVGIQSLVTFAVALSTLLVFVSSFLNKKAYWKLTRFDFFCGLLSVTGLICWYFTKNPNLAIVFSIAADLSAGIPTLIKSYKYPETENWSGYLASLISVGIVILTLTNLNFAFFAFPFYIFCYDLTVLLLIKIRQKRLISANPQFNRPIESHESPN